MAKLPVRTNMSELVRRELAADCVSLSRQVKTQFGSASILQDGRVVFNIGGNKYRIVVWINYPYRIVYIRFIGTHKQYDYVVDDVLTSVRPT